MNGLPLVIIEAKHPSIDLEEALHEARLYATEVNARFPKSINPCHKIIVTNGLQILGSSWDSTDVDIRLSFEDIYTENPLYSELIKYVSKESLANFCKKVLQSIRGSTTYNKPLRMLGGLTVQNEELVENSFGTSLALEYRYLFNPNTADDRINVVKNAYVASRRRLKNIDPINKIIRAANPPSVTQSQEIEDTSNPEEIFSKLRDRKCKNELLLLIGSVGSGKSTFIDFLKEVALPDDIKSSLLFITIDLNIAPLSRENIYTWLLERLIKELKSAHPNIDFDELSNIRKLYAVEVQRFEKGPGSLLEKSSEKYKELLAQQILVLQDNNEITSKALVRYLCAERGKLLIVVLDNCDKRNKDDQLLMFDVAKWLQHQMGCLVFLPIRDVTFDHHRKEPPLDTVIKDLVFRIDPPSLMEVLYKRVNYALSQMKADGKEMLYYVLPNGMRVEYPREELGFYVACILRSLFQNDNFFRRLIIGIAGRDIRKGLEIFLDFCKSGHISAAELFKIRQSDGNYVLPNHLVTRVLLRGNRRYYHDAVSRVKNLFFSLPEDTIPDPFVRISILKWLKNRYRVAGPNGIKGYHKISRLISDLMPLGHSAERIKEEIVNLVKAECIHSESQDPHLLDDDELIIISPSGHVHLELLYNLDYLATCAEDVWYKDFDTATRISKRITGQIGLGHYTRECVIENVEDLLHYLIGYREFFISNPDVYLADNINLIESLVDFSEVLNKVQDLKRQLSFDQDTQKLIDENPSGKIVEAEVVSIQKYGIFVEFGLNGAGFIPTSQFLSTSGGFHFENIEVGDLMPVEIIKYNKKHGRFTVKLIIK